MDDIKFPDESNEDDYQDSPEDIMEDLDTGHEEEIPEALEEDELDEILKDEAAKPGGASTRVSITFGRFVKLVANHSFLDIVERNSDEEIVISSNLLSDLANAHDRGSERKLPIVFLVGIVLGVAITYFLLTR